MSDIARTVTIDLEYAEVIVLAHLLDRNQRGNGSSDFVDDAAEVAALNSLRAALEPKIDEAFDAGYSSVLRASKARLTGND